MVRRKIKKGTGACLGHFHRFVLGVLCYILFYAGKLLMGGFRNEASGGIHIL